MGYPLYIITGFALIIAACEPSSKEFDYSDFSRVIKKNKFELFVPGYLHPDKTLNKNADLQYRDSLNNTFLLVIREEIPDLAEDSIEITLEEYLIYAQAGIIESLGDPHPTQDTLTEINEVPALSCEIRGDFAGHQLYYRLTVLMNEDYFYQIVYWTLKELKESREEDFIASVMSFKIL